MADATVVELTQGDTQPMEIEVSDINGPVPLVDGSTVVFRIDQREGVKAVTVTCDVPVVDSNRATVPWGNDDLDTPGLYDSEVEVTFPNGVRKTFPSKQVLRVRPQLG